MVDRLLKKLGATEDIVRYDDEGLGCIGNALRIWGEDYGDDVTHVLVLNDDADVVDNFTEVAQKCIDKFPNAIFGFWNNQLRWEHRERDTPYMLMKNHNVKGISILMPRKHIGGYLAFYDKHLRPIKYQHDDGACRMYAFLNDIPVFCTIPNLVEELCPQNSVISRTHNSANNYSRVWTGRADAADFDAEDYNVSPAFSINTHLKKDNELQILIKEKMKARKGMVHSE